jgi:hypothetical protein
MHIIGRRMGVVRGLLAGAFLAVALPVHAARVELAPHRAIYDLKLVSAQGKRPVESVRGRILYDFSGSACDGYALQFRQVSQIDTEGKVMLSDLRAVTWEDAAAKSFRFNSQNFVDQNLVDSVDGKAERRSTGINVSLTKPSGKKFDIDPGTIFPTEHIRRIIDAAQQGKTLLELPVYDGSESGEKVYDTLTVIGHPIAPGTNVPGDAAGKAPAFARLMRWPVKISYFERGKERSEATPVYSIGFELYENGVSRALILDYNDFVISGEMTQIEVRQPAACK